MALKDYKWLVEGEYQFSDDLRLRDAIISIKSVHYDAETRVATNEVCFVDGGERGLFKHVRSIAFTLPSESQESISAENVADFIELNFPTAILITEEYYGKINKGNI